MKIKGSLLKLTISLFIFFVIIIDLALILKFNFFCYRRIKIRFEERMLENNLKNIIRRDIYFNENIENYKKLKDKNKIYLKGKNINYYLAEMKYSKLDKIKLKKKEIILDGTAIGKVYELTYYLNEAKKRIFLEEER